LHQHSTQQTSTVTAHVYKEHACAIRYARFSTSLNSNVGVVFCRLEVEEDTTVVELNLYQQIIGSLLYLASLEGQTRYFDSSLHTEQIHKCTNKVLPHGCQESFSVFTRDNCLALEYCSGDIKMNVFVDSDYAGDTNSWKSTSGMANFLGSS
jgi:hypothetical protein